MAAILLSLLSLFPMQGAARPVGASTIQGMVIDAATQAPLAGARVWLVDLGLTAFTDSAGRFEFAAIPAGSYTLTVSEIGYIFVKRKVDLADKALQGVVIPLAEGQGTYEENVTVVAERIQPTEPGVAAQSTIGSGGLQSLRSVAVDDPIRAMQAMPGVAAGDDFRSEFSVRGASLRQTATVIDGIATPLLVHSVKGREDTGSIAMINTDVLDSASLLAGAQPQRDGNWLGGTLKFTVREGSRSRTQLRGAASDTGAAAVVEGPLGSGKRGSWLFSLRRSYADWLIKKIDPEFGSALGFTDSQSKFTYDLTSRQQLQWLSIGGIANYFQNKTSFANGLHTAQTRSAVNSVSWRYLRPSFQLTQRVSHGYSDFQNFGVVGQNQGDGRTRSIMWRADAVWEAKPWLTVEGGGNADRLHDERTLRLYYSVNATSVRLRNEDHYSGDRALNAAWTSATYRHPRGALVVGARAVSERTRRPMVSPWVLGEWKPAARLTIRGGVDTRLQYPELYQSLASSVPLVPERAESYDLGAEVALPHELTARVNGFRRNERDIIRSYMTEPRLSAIDTLMPAGTPVWWNSLEGTSRGAEFVLQRKAAAGLVGWASYAWNHTRYHDRLTFEDFDGDFDQRHTINVFLEERLSYRTAVSAKIRMGSSPPLVGYFTGSADALYVAAARNEVRLPPYQRIDLRANRTYTFDRRRMTLFLEIINLTNRRNLGLSEGAVRFASGRYQALNFTEKLIPWIPSVGVLFEF